MYDLTTIITKISDLCEENKISINQMLKAAGLAASVMDNIKRGRVPSIDKIHGISDYFNCSVDYLLGRTDDPSMHTLDAKVSPVEKGSLGADDESDVQPVMIRYYDMPASAGIGNFLDDESPYEYINVENSANVKRADFIIRVSGSSMLPKFKNGDYLLVEKTSRISEGETGVFILNGESYVKKLGHAELISLNPEYDNISINREDSVYCIGRVISLLPQDCIL